MAFVFTIPKRLFLRYLLDWFLILAFIAIAGSLSYIKPNHRPFNPYNPYISFPHVDHEKIPTSALICLAIIFPGVVILCFCLLAPATSSAFSNESKETLWRRKFVNLNRAFLGLGLSIALAMCVTDVLKNIIGKPRPDLISRCQPDWKKVESIVNSTHGGVIQVWDVLVTSDVCTTTNRKRLNDGFRSFPSGHSSMSFAGLGFLCIFMYTSFVLTTAQSSPILPTLATEGSFPPSPTSPNSSSQGRKPDRQPATTSLYPPQSLPIIFFCVLSSPLFIAAYIASSRFSDFRHHGFDILSGSTIGISVALLSSWWYALPSAGGVGRGRTRANYHFPNMGGMVDGLRRSNGSGANGHNGDLEQQRTESHPLVVSDVRRDSRGDGHDAV